MNISRIIRLKLYKLTKDFGYVISNQSYFLKWLILGSIVGVIAGFGALVFYYSIKLSESFFLQYLLGAKLPLPKGENLSEIFAIKRAYLIPFVVAFGGLISGYLIFKFAPEAEGHGTDAAIDAYHNKQGNIRPRVIFLKTIASAITIGSGGSAGREGPTALISAGIGSLIGKILHLNVQDKRKIVAIGIGAGIGTIFKAPIGGAILAAEVLYKRDLQSEVIYPAIVASAIGYSIFGSFVGFEPIFGFYKSPFNPLRLPFYIILGVVCGYLAIVYPKTFYYVKEKFAKLNINNIYKPAIGAFISGLISLIFPEVIGVGYGWIQLLIDGKFSVLPTFGLPLLLIFLIMPFVKIIATAFTIGSGGSGGVFAPGMFIGAFTGVSLGVIFHYFFPTIVSNYNIGAFVIVGMLALFGAAGKVPIAVTLMVVEMTGSLQLLPALMIAVSISYLISGSTTIYKSQVNTQKDSPAHFGEFNIPFLERLKISDIGIYKRIFVKPTDSIETAKDLMIKNFFFSLPVVENDKFLGTVYLYDIINENNGSIDKFVKIGTASATISTTLEDAWKLMSANKTTWLPVVEDSMFLGIVSFADISDIYSKKLKELNLDNK
ncbi:MAG: chloride channel protein [Desulfurella sp.]|uniref:chloride channel protein n=1 Tax=Desulfurella sp. TaxID=1962857 RepID=UPI003D098457